MATAEPMPTTGIERRPDAAACGWSSVRGRVQAWVLLFAAALAGGGLGEVRGEGTVTTNTTTALVQALSTGGLVRLTFAETLVAEVPLVISRDTVLEGAVAGGRLATLSGGGVRRLFHVLPGVRFEIRDCVVREGVATNGGGIYNEGVLHASNVVFSACQASGSDGAAGRAGLSRPGVGGDGTGGDSGAPGLGGAIFNAGEIVLLDCILSANTARGGKGGAGGDGGVGTWGNGIGGNGGSGAVGYGGAIHGTIGSRLTVNNTLFTGNSATGGDGGAGGSEAAILRSGQGGPGASAAGGAIHTEGFLWVVRSTFATNAVSGGKAALAGAPEVSFGRDGGPGGHAWGGALASWFQGAVVNSTFVTNRVVGGAGGDGAPGTFTSGDGGRGGDGLGGAIYARGSLGLTNLTIAWNVVTNGAGGLAGSETRGRKGASGRAGGTGVAGGDEAAVSLVNSIVVTTGTVGTVYGGVQDAGHNLFSDGGTGRAGAGSLYDSQPGFGDYRVWAEFTTPAFQLLASSPALDAADAAAAPAVDQRGVARPVGRGPDIGSMESDASRYRLEGNVYDANGRLGVAGVVVEAGGFSAVTDAQGRFRFGTLPSGIYTVGVAGGGWGYTPRMMQLFLSADTINLVFREAGVVVSYQPDGALPGPGTLSGLGVPGRSYRLEVSEDLREWTEVGTATADGSGRMSVRHHSGSAARLFYRWVQD